MVAQGDQNHLKSAPIFEMAAHLEKVEAVDTPPVRCPITSTIESHSSMMVMATREQAFVSS